MARYYAGIHGNRGEATRLGTPASGLRAFINGWHIGVDVYIKPQYKEKDSDEIILTMTTGSGGRGRDVSIGVIRETPEGPVFTPSEEVLRRINT